jgi:SAM-dependent methyltransferase
VSVLRILDRLACPACLGALGPDESALRCTRCASAYALAGEVADLRPPGADRKPEFDDWTDHWSEGKQRSPSQQFFSVYRKLVFARTVAYFIDRFFPASGVFLEAGSGTSETSIRVNKRGGARVLVAVDLILPVVRQAHPVMDVRLAGDVFRLPFADASLDGLWNVGVMEHFTHDLIDGMLVEFHRVLKPGAPLLLLWPATDSLPQKGLRLVERVANLRPRSAPLRFHPAEISKLRSSEEGRQVLSRNGIEPLFVDPGWRSLMAFKTVVGRKPAPLAARDLVPQPQ